MADRQHAPSGVATVMDTLSSSTHHHPPWRQLSMPSVDRLTVFGALFAFLVGPPLWAEELRATGA